MLSNILAEQCLMIVQSVLILIGALKKAGSGAVDGVAVKYCLDLISNKMYIWPSTCFMLILFVSFIGQRWVPYRLWSRYPLILFNYILLHSFLAYIMSYWYHRFTPWFFPKFSHKTTHCAVPFSFSYFCNMVYLYTFLSFYNFAQVFPSFLNESNEEVVMVRWFRRS